MQENLFLEMNVKKTTDNSLFDELYNFEADPIDLGSFLSTLTTPSCDMLSSPLESTVSMERSWSNTTVCPSPFAMVPNSISPATLCSPLFFASPTLDSSLSSLQTVQEEVVPKMTSPVVPVSKKRQETEMNQEELQDLIADKRKRNTESARRSRERKASRLAELENENEMLRQENERLRKLLGMA